MANIKICSKCGKIGLDQCDFRLYWNRVGYYYKTECLECEAGKSLHHYYNNKEHCNEYSREYCNQWRIDNKEYKKEYDRSYYQNHKDKHKSRALNSRFNIGLKKYNTILKGQDFRCGICRTHISNLPISLAVDHNHTTGKVRGLLCGRCNLTLGMVYEDKELLLGMINYLDKWGDKKC